ERGEDRRYITGAVARHAQKKKTDRRGRGTNRQQDPRPDAVGDRAGRARERKEDENHRKDRRARPRGWIPLSLNQVERKKIECLGKGGVEKQRQQIDADEYAIAEELARDH